MPRSPDLPELKFVVIGAKNTGKSTFIRCALDLKRPLSSPLASKKMSLEGDVFLISLIELQLQDVDIADNAILWPHTLQEAGVSRVDGVLALYDVSERETLSGIPILLNACSKTNTPCVLVSCKCDKVTNSQGRLYLRDVERKCMKETGIEACQTLQNRPESHKRCISVVLRSYTSNQAGNANRPRALTAAQLGMPQKGSPTQTSKFGHIRAASEVAAGSRPKSHEAFMSQVGEVDDHIQEREHQDEEPEKNPPTVAADRDMKDESLQPLTLDFGTTTFYEQLEMNPAVGTPTTIANSFLERGNDEQDDSNLPTGDLPDNDSQDTEAEFYAGNTFNELVDRLLAQPMSKADSKFVSVFLCLYRKFAAPAELLSAIIKRFESLSQNGEQPMLRLSSQLRYLAVLVHWTAEYPGDFAHQATLSQMNAFVQHLASNRLFAAAANEMMEQLLLVKEDDDTEWLCSDQRRGSRSTINSFARIPSLQDSVTAALTELDTSERERSGSTTTNPTSISSKHAKASSTVSSLGRNDSLSSSPSMTKPNNVEFSQRQAELLTPISRMNLGKPQWHQFIEISDEDIARELTRIDWIMYSAMKPRDLIRHVSLTSDQKEKCRGLEHVNRMINQFNHIAFWVANMILLRDKAKHRARALEKFMGIAWKLRQLNNYNSLGAVIAGINGTAVHRLVQTHELVSAQARRDFMRLEILMSTQKSHFAYRLAWDNTLGEKIPFLPLHRRDLVSAEEGNRTHIPEKPDRINWRKFDVMGDTVIGIQKSQGTPYPQIQRNPDIQRLILEGKFSKDDDELYERSLQLEGPAANESRRRFNWFQR